MKKKMAALLAFGLLCSSLNVSAAPKVVETEVSEMEEEANKDESNSEVTIGVQDAQSESDPEIEYAYNGPDYVFARVDYGSDSYAVKRTEYGIFLKELQQIGTREELFLPIMLISAEEEKEEPSGWIKDNSTPWLYWTEEQNKEYETFAASFAPDGWQTKMLEYYTLQEIFAYYMGYGYSIDESALRKQAEIDRAKEEQKEEIQVNISEGDYEKVMVYYNLDSMYDKSETYCVTQASKDDLEKLLSRYDAFSDEESNISDPNTFISGKYHFEIGTAEEYITSYEKVGKEDAKAAVAFINKNKVLNTNLAAGCYMVRVRSKTSGKNVEKIYMISPDTFLELITDYLGTNSDYTGETAFSIADDAKG